MKISLLIVCSVLAGVWLGFGMTAVQFQTSGQAAHVAGASDLPRPAFPPSGGPQPRVVVDQEEYDFGTMEPLVQRSHAFRFTNAGDYPLELRMGGTSCSCTISKLVHDQVAPGETAEVILEWTPRESAPQFRQSAIVFTNDPNRSQVNLTISGVVAAALETQPRELVFSALRPDEQQTAALRLFSMATPDLKIVQSKFGVEETANHFEATWKPLAADEVQRAGAKCGWLIRVTVKPGLPIGAIHQKLEITTSAADSRPISVPIEGRVASPISVFGSQFDSATGVLALGEVRSQEGARRELTVFVRGPQAAEVTLKVAQVSPDFLKVTLGESKQLKQGTVVQVPLVIEVPKGSRPVNRLGTEQGKLGEVILESSDPNAKTVRIRVQFAVEN